MPPSSSSPTPVAPPLSNATKRWYGLGQFAEGLKNEAFALFLLFYYTAVLGLSGTSIGVPSSVPARHSAKDGKSRVDTGSAPGSSF